MSKFDEYANLCMNCTNCNIENKVCPECEFDERKYKISKQLPLRAILQDRYLIGKSVDEDGEGIGYVGYDVEMKSIVYIKEFMPANLCQRGEGGEKIKVIPGCEIVFNENLEAFLQYARSVARLRDAHAFIPLFNIFEENNTAYTVSEWVENITLKEFVKCRGESITWSIARPLFMPVLSSLIEMKKVGINHFAINPDNLIVLRHGKMKLKGFSIPAIRQVDTDLNSNLYDGCSALEQYIGSAPLGEYTDIYGFTASLFFTLTSELPMNALKRSTDGRLLIPKSTLKIIPPHIITALAEGLQVDYEKRTQTFEELQDSLSASPSIYEVVEDISNDRKKNKASGRSQKKKNVLIAVISGLITCAILLVASLFCVNFFNTNKTESISSEALLSNIISSEASTDITLPNLVNKNYEEVSKESTQNGKYEIVVSSEEFDDEVEEGNIITQTPAYSAGKKIKVGSIITVVVSKGSENKTLPDVSGMTLSDASAKLTQIGLVPKVERKDYSNVYDEGTVIGYASNSSGDILKYGETVKLIVSKGSY